MDTAAAAVVVSALVAVAGAGGTIALGLLLNSSRISDGRK